ncbi:MAG: DNA modification methylase [Minisyncoccia bacterium]
MKKITWQTEKRKISELTPFKENPRFMTEQQAKDLKESIEKFGLVEIPVVNTDNMILAGHQRIQTLKDIGEDGEIEVRVPSRKLTVDESVEYLLRSNKNVGSWDEEKLFDFGEDILLSVGFSDREVTGIFDKQRTKDDDFDIEEAERNAKSTKVKRGDIYQLGDHRIMCGDSTDEKDVALLMAGKKADMVFTDPPYNVDYQGGGSYAEHGTPKREKIENDKMSTEDFNTFLNLSIRNMLNNCTGSFYICMSSKELASLKEVFEKNGSHWQSFIIWVKNTFTLSRSDWQNQYEPILYGWNDSNKKHYFTGFRDEGNVWENLEKLKPSYNSEKDITDIKLGNHHLQIKGKVEGYVCRKNDSVDIWYEKKPIRSVEHPTMKPVALVAKAIKASSILGGGVLDLFVGSGTTIVASEETGRICFAMEMEPKYVQVCIDRWQLLTGKEALKL